MFGSAVQLVANQQRDRAIDHARGIASLIMIQGHAFHAWVAGAHKADPAYLFTRVFATLPLPAFLVLAGAGVVYRVRSAEQSGEPARALRRSLVGRGLQVVAVGYLVNLAYALLDGVDSLETLLRADVLQVIGLSIALLGLCAGGGSAPLSVARLVCRASLVALAVTVLCAPLTRLVASLALSWPLAARAVVAPLVDVPGLTRMPLVPLFAWCAAGSAAAAMLTPGGRKASPGRLLLLALLSLALIALGDRATGWALGEAVLTRRHHAVVWNVVEYAGRGLLVLGAGALLVARLPAGAQRLFSRLGRASLWAYVFHIPFCYGRLGLALRDEQTVLSALPYVLLLMAASYLVVELRLSWPELARVLAKRRAASPT